MWMRNPNPMKLLRAATLKTFHRHMLRNGVSPPHVVMIRGFAAAAGNLQSESAIGLLKATPNLVSLNAVLQGLCRERKLEETEDVLEEMNRKGLAPDETTYTSLVHLFCSRGQEDTAYKVLNSMIDPSIVTYNQLIDAYANCFDRRVEEAVGILRGMAERGLSPDAVSYGTIISGFRRKVKLERAFEMKMEMVEKGILPNAGTYKLLLETLCNWGRLSEAFDLLREMLRGGVSPYEYTYTIFMVAYCEKGEFSKPFHLHDEMIHKCFLPDFVTGFSPSLVTYNALIHGLCFFGRAEEALVILRGMAETGLSPDTVSYTTVVSGFCRIGELRKAYDLKLEMDDYRNEDSSELSGDVYSLLMDELLDEVNYTSVINAYCADGELVRAQTLVDELTHFVDVRWPVIYGVLINGLDKKARTREAKEKLLSLFYSSCTRSWQPLTYDTLIENCSNNELKSVVELVKGFRMRGLKNEAASVLNTALQWNYKPDGAVYNLLIVEHCRYKNVDNAGNFFFYNLDKAYNMYMEMVHYGFAPHMFSVLALIKALYYSRRYNEMIWVVQNTLRSCNLNDSELLEALNEIDVRKGKFNEDALLNVLAEIAMDGLLLNGGKCS